jgi:very-short-patch-repair endonuclease
MSAQQPLITPQRTQANLSQKRKELVERARQGWIKKLIDLSRRNRLLYYLPSKTGILDLSAADPERMVALLSGETVPVRRLLPGASDEALRTALRNIGRQALVNAEEKGLQTLFVVLGMASWPALDGGRPAESPVLLLPVSLGIGAQGSQSFPLARAGNIQVNLVLLHVLERQFGIELTAEDLISHLLGDDEGEPFDPGPLYAELRNRAGEVPGFQVKACAVLGNFAFQKMAMVKDLQERAEELEAHDIIAAIAGDSDARSAAGASEQGVDPRELDGTPPENEFVILDADSSQQCAIHGILAEQNAVVHGPPGTGKSQTIANLIASLAAIGKRVLFVAEKRAALDVVLSRLNNVGLGHLAIDLHGADLSPRRVIQQVARTLDAVRASTPVDCGGLHSQLVERRNRLNRHVDRLHVRREPAGKSIYELQGALLRLGRLVTPSTRWRGEELNRLTSPLAERVRDLLIEVGGFRALFLRTNPSPWTGAGLPTGEAVQRALDIVARMSNETCPNFLASLHSVLTDCRLMLPTSVRGVAELTALLDGVQRTLDEHSEKLYRYDLSGLLRDLAPAGRGLLPTVWAWCTSAGFRRARAAMVALRLAGGASPQQLLSGAVRAADELTKWRRVAQEGSLPCGIPAYELHRKNFQSLFNDVAALGEVLARRRLQEMSIDELGALVRSLAKDGQTPYEIPKLTEIESALDKAGVARLVAEIRAKQPVERTWPLMFDYSWFASTLDAASQQDPDVRGFKGAIHNRRVDEFSRLDEEHIAIAAARVRRAHAERAVATMNAHPDQEQLVRAEAAKIKRHLPLRRLFAQAVDVLTAVCPCWMASPLSVSQLLDSRRQYFDFVIFDEASQVLPEDAIPSILRGRKLIVAGDNKQLPPTTFFVAADEEEYAADEEVAASEGFESVLDIMMPFVRQHYLDWHYRSRDEALINFSNHHLYGDRLVTFPGPGGPPAISHVLVEQTLGADGQEESSTAEVRKVVELVIDHARAAADETLGVITMGIRHMNRVQAALDHELENHRELDEFFDPNRNERFFIKNLERVQGDERDVIIISIGYGKDRAGNLPLHFGPLLSEGGRRRLNVAVTRARSRVAVVSSFSHHDIDLARVHPGSGVELLRDYLQYASTSGKRLGDAALTGVPLNDFEADVFDVLSSQDLRLVPQLGVARFRIDMAAEHPAKPGRFVLAIECDGASYHSSYTARDRDRLRQQQLEQLGWRFHRIWSTDWFMRKDEEVGRALKAFEEAVQFADKLDSGMAASGKNGGGENSRCAGNATTGLHARGSRPAIPYRTAIAQYSMDELVRLIGWINSDGQLRTDDQIVSEMVDALGFSRRGVRIEAAIRRAITAYRAKSKK